MNKKQFPILILSLLVLLISSTDLSAQKPKKIFKYQGEVVAGLGVMLSQESGTGNLHIINGEKTTVMKIDERLKVEPTSALFGELKALLGPSAVA